jgi:heptosyltransferase II
MKLAIFLPNWVGDACMAIPALRALRNGVSRNTTFLGISRPGPAALLQSQPWIENWLVYKPRSKGPILNRRKLVAALRSQKCDAAILMTNSLGSAAVAALSGIPRRIGYARDGRSWLLTDRLAIVACQGRPLPTPAIDYYLAIAEYFGCPSVERNMELALDPKYIEQAEQLWSSIGFDEHRPTVVINNHAAKNVERVWPEEYALRLATKLVRNLDVQVLFHCGPQEVETTNRIVQQANHPSIQSMGCMTDLPLGLSEAVFARASTIVTTDSGARHIAVAMNRPVISLFGGTQPCWTTTYNVPESLLQADVECDACLNRPRHKNGSSSRCQCMARIKPERVYIEVLERMKASRFLLKNSAA